MSSDFGEIGNLAADVTTVGLTAGMRGAKAAGDAANAQMNEQKDVRGIARANAEPSPEELKQLNSAITANEQDIARKQKLLDSADPALIEAGSQALKLLRGQEASTLAPLKAQFDQQETALRAKLAAQLGPGYENSTAGIQALQAFNQQKNMAFANAQQSALGMLLGSVNNAESFGSTQNNISNSENLASLFGNIQNRKINAVLGTPIDATAPFVGTAAGAAANQQFVNRGVQLGAALLTGGLAGGAPGTTPSPGGAGDVLTGGAGNSPLGNTQINTSGYNKYL